MQGFPIQRQVPAKFGDHVRAFAREVLYEHAHGKTKGVEDVEAWILEFGVKFFTAGGMYGYKRAGAGSSPAAGSAGAAPGGDHELQEQILSLFAAVDKDRAGSLHHADFREVVRGLATTMAMSLGDYRHVASLAEEGEDGRVAYASFVPLVIDLLQAMAAKRAYSFSPDPVRDAAEDSKNLLLVNGCSAEELQSALAGSCAAFDREGSGVIPRSHFAAALRNCDVGLTSKQVNVLLSEAVESEVPETVNYGAYLSVVPEILKDLLASQVAYRQLPFQEAELLDFLTGNLSRYAAAQAAAGGAGAAGAAAAGVLPTSTARSMSGEESSMSAGAAGGAGPMHPLDIISAIRSSDLPVSPMQLQSLLALSVTDELGLVPVPQFVSLAAGAIADLLKASVQQELAEQVYTARAENPLPACDQEQLLAALQAASGGSDRIPNVQLRAVLGEEGLKLDDMQANAVLNASMLYDLQQQQQQQQQQQGAAADGDSSSIAFLVGSLHSLLRELAVVETLQLLRAGGGAGGAAAGGKTA